MTPQELELARSLLASVQNTTVQGWDILVRGTVISNAINIATLSLSLLISLVVSYLGYRFDKGCERGTNAFCAFFVVGFVCLIVLYLLLGSALVGVFAPEYTLLNKIINTATGSGC